MGAKVAKHNSKLLKNSQGGPSKPPPKCNCQKSKKQDCPIPGACNQDGVVYQAVVSNDRGEAESYIGVAKNFKIRLAKHKASLQKQSSENSTILSTYFWKEKNAGRGPCIKWNIIESNIPTFNSVFKICRLCMRENFYIAFHPEKASLNSRNEVFSHCRHMGGCLIETPPD